MVRQLLSFARGGSGEQQVVDVALLVDEMRRLVEGTFPKNIRMAVAVEDGRVLFLDDLYGHDRRLEALLSRRH